MPAWRRGRWDAWAGMSPVLFVELMVYWWFWFIYVKRGRVKVLILKEKGR